jgi:hypothetical protein
MASSAQGEARAFAKEFSASGQEPEHNAIKKFCVPNAERALPLATLYENHHQTMAKHHHLAFATESVVMVYVMVPSRSWSGFGLRQSQRRSGEGWKLF